MKNYNCAICKKKSLKIISKKVRDSAHHRVVKCDHCGLMQLSPMPSDTDNKNFYDHNLQTKNINAPSNLKTIKQKSVNDTKRRADMVSKYLRKSNTILDVGSGYGFFLQEMIDRGYDATGIELSKEIRKASAKITKAKVLNLNLIKNHKNLSRFDCITLFHVLEHVNNPILFLKSLKEHLRNSNSKLIIEVPNSNDLLLNTCQKYRNFYWQRAHLFYFNTKTLKKIVQKSGFSVINTLYIQRYGIKNLINWLTLGRPQIEKPIFQIDNTYKWLEEYYKNYLSNIGRSDTLILVITPK